MGRRNTLSALGVEREGRLGWRGRGGWGGEGGAAGQRTIEMIQHCAERLVAAATVGGEGGGGKRVSAIAQEERPLDEQAAGALRPRCRARTLPSLNESDHVVMRTPSYPAATPLTQRSNSSSSAP